MDSKNTESNKSKESADGYPAPEVLAPRADDGSAAEPAKKPDSAASPPLRRRHKTYRPSHKATFISLAVIVAVLAVNAGIVVFVLKKQGGKALSAQGAVTLSQGALDKVGVNRSKVGDSGL